MTDPLELDRLKEECGVLGVYAPGVDVSRVAFFGLFALQHRGQESAGIAVADGSRVRTRKGLGLVSQVFTKEFMKGLEGHIAIGHTRYSTMGGNTDHNAQPIACQSLVGDVGLAHNGNLINAIELREELERQGEVFTSTSDSEVLARLLVRHWDEGPEEAVRVVMRKAKGAYSVTVATPKALIGFRDPSGIRPLTVGTVPGGFYMASETCAFGPVGAEPTRELGAGEIAIVDPGGLRIVKGVEPERGGMCLFEFIYFARPDSRMYGTTLYTARERMGEKLAEEHPAEADIVVPVPDSGIPAALGYSRRSGIPFREGMMKSRYIHRTFIQPDDRMRKMGVRMKLTPLVDHIEGKRVVLVDDSIVRGNTTKEIVRMLFDSKAAEVHVRITAPPIRFPCFYGIDMASKGELIAAMETIEGVRKEIGATSLGYLSIEGAVGAVGPPTDRFCVACFNGDYPIPVPDNLTKHAFEEPPRSGEFVSLVHSQPKLPET